VRGKIEVIAPIEDLDVIKTTSKHLGLEESSKARARSPQANIFDLLTIFNPGVTLWKQK
jgi:hypothetical protein